MDATAYLSTVSLASPADSRGIASELRQLIKEGVYSQDEKDEAHKAQPRNGIGLWQRWMAKSRSYGSYKTGDEPRSF
jgi:hypothetical protein